MLSVLRIACFLKNTYLNLSHFTAYFEGVIAPVHLSKALRATPRNFLVCNYVIFMYELSNQTQQNPGSELLQNTNYEETTSKQAHLQRLTKVFPVEAMKTHNNQSHLNKSHFRNLEVLLKTSKYG